ncbi:hypothetical protein ACWD0G_00210, partial [Streptomyces goshikiensis]
PGQGRTVGARAHPVERSGTGPTPRVVQPGPKERSSAVAGVVSPAASARAAAAATEAAAPALP